MHECQVITNQDQTAERCTLNLANQGNGRFHRSSECQLSYERNGRRMNSSCNIDEKCTP